jgi:hypothetical protein
MTLKNVGASIQQRLLNHAKASGENYQRTLSRYAIERLLYRMSQTRAKDDYILKGATLFVTWPKHVFRPSGDVDFLGQGEHDPEALLALFKEICAVEQLDDGIVYNAGSLMVAPLREDEPYPGARITLQGNLGSAVIPVFVDVGFGDFVFPSPIRRVFPGILPGLPAADILMYPPETVVAEKYEAIVRFGEATTRIKDFYDIWVISRTFEFQLSILVEAVGGTFRRRGTSTPTVMPAALMQAFTDRGETKNLWAGFLRRTPLALPPSPFEELVSDLRQFLNPVISGLEWPESARGTWNRDRYSWE